MFNFLKKYNLLVLFTAFIVIFSVVDIVKPDRKRSETELRELAQKPEFSIKSLLKSDSKSYKSEYTTKYEKYIEDQFVLRDNWIDIKSITELSLGKIQNNNVAMGKDGYQFEIYRTMDTRKYAVNKEYINKFFNQYPQLNFTFAMVPNSYAILEEKAPYGLGNIDQRKEIALLNDGIQQENVKKMDLFPAMEAEKEAYIYYKTDHHWTTYGAYLAYKAYVENLGLTPVAYESLTPIEVPNFKGSFYNKSKFIHTQPDTLTYFEIPTTSVTIDGKEYEDYFDRTSFEKADKYAAFLRGNNGVTILKSAVNKDHQKGKTSRVMVIKDSYSNAFAPFLLYNFDEVYVIDLRSITQSLKEILTRVEFDDILVMYNYMSFIWDTELYKLIR